MGFCVAVGRGVGWEGYSQALIKLVRGGRDKDLIRAHTSAI
jgi:hypothetical protein